MGIPTIIGHVDALGYLHCANCEPCGDSPVYSDTSPHNSETCDRCHKPIVLASPTLKFSEVTAPVHWASALVNGDESGIEDDADYTSFLAFLKAKKMSVVSVVDDSERFTWSGHLYHSSSAGVTVCDYVVHTQN